jgi:hypothetical protein
MMVSGKKILGLALVALPLAFMSTLTGCLTDDKKAADTTKPGDSSVAWGAGKDFRAGAQGHLTLGSTVDLDAANSDDVVMLSAKANANKGKIDIVFAFDSTTSWIMMYNGQAAFDNGIKLAQHWDSATTYPNLKNVMFVKVATKPATATAAVAAYAAGTPTDNAWIQAAGEMYLVNTSADDLVLVTIKSISSVAVDAEVDFTLNKPVQ